MRFGFALLLYVLLFNACQASATDSWHVVTLKTTARRYLLHEPANATKPASLVIVLHGDGGSAKEARHVSQMDSVADREGFLAAYPQGSGWMNLPPLSWNAGYCCGYAAHAKVDDVSFISALIDDVARQVPLDPGRVYATGISNGGMMAYRLGCELSGKIAAIAPVAGALDIAAPSPKEPVSLVVFHGTADAMVLYQGGKSPADSNGRVDASVAETVKRWAAFDGCTSSSRQRQQGRVLIEEYENCAGQSGIAVYTIDQASHAWPGGKRGWLFGAAPAQDISASEVMWRFFRRHPRSHGNQ